MANEVLKIMTRIEGRCCIYSFLSTYNIKGQRHLSLREASDIALKLGIGFSTVYRYNHLVQNGIYAPCHICKYNEKFTDS